MKGLLGAVLTDDVAGAAATALIREGVLGTLLVISILGVAWLIQRLLSVQDLRVADQLRANDAMERTRDKTSALMEQMTAASMGTNSALDRLTDALGDNTRALAETRMTVQALQNTTDSVIREAVRKPNDAPRMANTGYSYRGDDLDRSKR